MPIWSRRRSLRKYLATIETLTLSVAIAFLILLLVSEIKGFSRKVTDFYAPTIHAVKSFAEATDNLKQSVKNKGTADEISLLRFRSSRRNLEVLVEPWDPAYREHIRKMLFDAQDILLNIEKQQPVTTELKEDIDRLDKEAARHVAMHETELDNARNGIERSALKIRIAAFLLLLMGVILTVREAKAQGWREAEKEKLSAIKAFISALEARDPYTKGHSLRVADYAKAVGKEIGLNKKVRDRLYLAALMHDIGKIGVRDEVLRKHGKLNHEEWSEMRNHPLLTARILQDFEPLREIITWALCHHEKIDGTGYPAGKRNDEIPLPAQILSLADAFDAMTSARPYRQAMTLEEALAEIERNKGIQWRKDVADALIRCMKNGAVRI